MHHAGGACFEFIGFIAGIPLLHDRGGRVSITNAAEAVCDVVCDVSRAHNVRPRAILYRDSFGVIDAMLLDHLTFAGFLALNATEHDEALDLLYRELGVKRSHLRPNQQGNELLPLLQDSCKPSPLCSPIFRRAQG